MIRRSLAFPMILIAVGALFLTNNLRPDVSVIHTALRWWPFLLIGFGVVRLAEVVYFFNRGEAVGGQGLSFGQALLLVLLCAGVYFGAPGRHRPIRMTNIESGGVELFGEQFDYPIRAQGDATGVTMLVLDNLRGNVSVTGSGGSAYAADGHKTVKGFDRREADRVDRDTQVRFVREGNQLIVRTNERGVTDARRIATDLEIRLPHGVSVEARGRSGDLTLASVNGTVDVQSDRGDVRLSEIGGSARVVVAHSGLVKATGLRGSLDVEGRGSDVQLEDIAGLVSVTGTYSGTLEFKNLASAIHFESDRTNLRIAKVPGTFTMDLGDIRASNLVGPVKLKTRSRDVHIDGFTEPIEVEIERGDIQLNPGRTPLARMEVKSHSGNVELTLPEHAEFDLHGSTAMGEVQNEYGEAVRAETDGRTGVLRSNTAHGPALNLQTDRGTITVKKQ